MSDREILKLREISIFEKSRTSAGPTSESDISTRIELNSAKSRLPLPEIQVAISANSAKSRKEGMIENSVFSAPIFTTTPHMPNPPVYNPHTPSPLAACIPVTYPQGDRIPRPPFRIRQRVKRSLWSSNRVVKTSHLARVFSV